MFESVCIREQTTGNNGGPIDLGFLAEALLFYQEVRVVGHVTILRQLVPACGPDVLLELLERGYLKIAYTESAGGIHTRQSGTSNELHSPISFTSPVYELQNAAPKIFTEVTGRSGRGRRMAARFTRLVENIAYEQNTLDAVRADILMVDPIEQAFREILCSLAPEYKIPQIIVSDIKNHNGEFQLKTNIDFVQANLSYHKRIPPSHSSLTTAHLLSMLLIARENLHYSSRFGSEIATSSVNAALLKLKISNLMKAHDKSLNTLTSFQDFMFDNGRSVREAINSGAKSFREVLELAKKAEKFKGWLKNQKPDADLCKEYHREVTSETWVDKLPSKTVRWMLFTGIGLGIDAIGAGGLGTISGVGVGAADQFLLDRLLKGWKPNQFVDGPLREFTTKSAQ